MVSIVNGVCRCFLAAWKACTQIRDHCTNLVDPSAVPPKPRLYRISEEELNVVKDTIDYSLARGWIRPSSSSYGAPVIIILKKTRESRIVIDY